jgi:hypothetical protein
MWLFGGGDKKKKAASPREQKPKTTITDAIKQQKEVIQQLQKKQT